MGSPWSGSAFSACYTTCMGWLIFFLAFGITSNFRPSGCPPTYIFGYLVASLFNINGVFLCIFLLVGNDNDQEVQDADAANSGANGLNEERYLKEYMKQTNAVAEGHEPVSNYVSLIDRAPASSDYSEIEHPIRTFQPGFACASCNMLVFLFFGTLASSSLLLVPYHKFELYLVEQSIASPALWERKLFLISYGIFLSSCVIAFVWRFFILSNKAQFEVTSYKAVPAATTERRMELVLKVGSVLLAIVLLVPARLAYSSYRDDVSTVFEYGNEITRRSTVYAGFAHVYGYTALGDPADDGSWCDIGGEYIDVELNVAFGGYWGCPTMSNQYCEGTIRTRLSCLFAHADNLGIEADTLDEYMRFRYSDDYGDDDDDANELGDYDFDEEPTKISWTGSYEYIIGDCSTCEVHSEFWMLDKFKSAIKEQQRVIVCFGASLSFLVWPLLATFRIIDHVKAVVQLLSR